MNKKYKNMLIYWSDKKLPRGLRNMYFMKINHSKMYIVVILNYNSNIKLKQ